MTLWFAGRSSDALALDGLLPIFASCGEDGVRELDPVTVDVKVSNGE